MGAIYAFLAAIRPQACSTHNAQHRPGQARQHISNKPEVKTLIEHDVEVRLPACVKAALASDDGTHLTAAVLQSRSRCAGPRSGPLPLSRYAQQIL